MGNSLEYYKMGAEEICKNVNESTPNYIDCEVENIKFIVSPHVYPSHKFRTTSFLLNSLKEHFQDNFICDMGCGPGIVGLFAVINGAKKVIQADINTFAVQNAIRNNQYYKFTDAQISTYLSDCFDSIPESQFDLIVFNIPFHNDNIQIDDPLKYAFFDPAFSSVRKFLKQARKYTHPSSKIFIAFSNKGDTHSLEKLFCEYGYRWELWKQINLDQQYDNRIYLLT
jgi:methylase of polypeptide subunit release factors